MKVYEYSIDIMLDSARDEARVRNDATRNKLRPVRRRLFTPTEDVPPGTTTQERALVRLLWGRSSDENQFARENGYVGSFHNCAFRLLYAVFGVDVIAYLFNQAWVPETTIDPFRPSLFLERLYILEQAVRGLKNKAKTPVHLQETAPYVAAGMGPELECFSEERHRLLLDFSLRELRGFGELGAARQWREKKQSVSIQIWEPGGFNDPECNEFMAEPLGFDEPEP